MSMSKRIPPNSAMSQRKTPLRKTLLSNWKTRNDSSKVNAILHPDVDLDNHRKFIHDIPDKPPRDKTKGVYRKCCLSTNTCYCREKPIKPKILSKPDRCMALEEIGKRIGNDNLSRTSLHCFCKVDSTEIPDSELIKKFQEELDSKSTSLQLTEQRKDYDVYREDQENEYLRELAEYQSEQDERLEEDIESDEDERQSKKPFSASNDAYSVSTVLGTRVADSLIGSSGFVTEGLDIEDIRKFRDDHYFETHGIDDDMQKTDVPDHTCIHQFKLDERFLPNPLNVDIYGRSRCLICSKPMEVDRMQLSKSHFGNKPMTSRNLRNFSKCYELGLFPRIINIGGEKSKIALKLSDNQIKFDSLLSRCRRPEYTNTFALRQQKMSY